MHFPPCEFLWWLTLPEREKLIHLEFSAQVNMVV